MNKYGVKGKAKQCTNCKEQKPFTAFNTRSDRKSHWRSECKHCQYQTQARRKRIIPAIVSRARNTLHYAVKVGNVSKPERCELCKATSEVQGHHDDYLLPLRVVWLCMPCHNAIHYKQRIVA